jgi:hypothetical protein
MQILWQMASLNTNGCLTAKFHIVNTNIDAPTEPFCLEQFYQPIYVKFHIDQCTMSQVKFSLPAGSSYKLSLLKEKVETGKYFCSSEPQQPQAQVQQYQQSKTMLSMKPANAQPQAAAQTPPIQPPLPSVTATPSPVTSQSEESQAIQDSSQSPSQQPTKKANLTGSLSTNIGSTVDILLNY